ncbi:SpoIIE family protein phosphatase [Azospirillum halopraeferens]|uniref:SpoIIE family protein phosphatase n=1 Tax=Azospirillum halopraeferens TaxID=34010 RepID=UPI0003F8FDAA|nr:SpoIIE family protein phosphatase [Azospirillum halopraeferens]
MLPHHCHHRVHVAAQSDLTTARGVLANLTAGMAGDTAVGEDVVGRSRLVVAELATNLIRHAGGGVLLLRGLGAAEVPGSACGRPAGIECLSLDKGPGIADIADALADRQDGDPAPGGGLGYGLGAVRRLSDRFDIHTGPGVGTAVLARVHPRNGTMPPTPGPFAWGVAMVPMTGCDACGDGWSVRPDGLALVVDGLGHGEAASVAARRAEAVFAAAPADQDVRDVLVAIHEALRGTRGAVACVLRLHRTDVEFSSIGNITGAVLSRRGHIPLGGRWGVVGYNAVPPPATRVPWEPGDQLVLHSDGCSQLMNLVTDRHLRHADPALAAAVLMRDGVGRIDDQTVLVLANRTGCRGSSPVSSQCL